MASEEEIEKNKEIRRQRRMYRKFQKRVLNRLDNSGKFISIAQAINGSNFVDLVEGKLLSILLENEKELQKLKMK